MSDKLEAEVHQRPASETYGLTMGDGSDEKVRVVKARVENQDTVASRDRLGSQDLYANVDDSHRSYVVGLLRTAKSALSEAQTLESETDFVQIDQALMTAHARVNRALNCRDIGDGFTAVVNAVNWSIANRDDVGLSRKQISAIIEALHRVIWSPYLHFDTAMSVLDRLEEEGLLIESPSLKIITAELDA